MNKDSKKGRIKVKPVEDSTCDLKSCINQKTIQPAIPYLGLKIRDSLKCQHVFLQFRYRNFVLSSNKTLTTSVIIARKIINPKNIITFK